MISESRTPNPDVPKSLEFDVFPLALHYKASYNSNIYLKEITAKNDCLLLQTALNRLGGALKITSDRTL